MRGSRRAAPGFAEKGGHVEKGGRHRHADIRTGSERRTGQKGHGNKGAHAWVAAGICFGKKKAQPESFAPLAGVGRKALNTTPTESGGALSAINEITIEGGAPPR